ncbi:hypothetical protein DWW15_16990 [Subdoligranulum sp. AF14-43]|nr:hypothetical protein DWW15_16990 [Subdoligranulum sp. AF14-43]
MRQSVQRGYAAEAIGGLEYSRAGDAWQIRRSIDAIKGAAPAGAFCLATAQISPAGGPRPLQIEMEYSPLLLLAILARGGGRSKGGGFSAAF